MRLRSTGLGRTEVEGELLGIRRVEDVVIFFVNTTKPVKWKTRMAFQERDLRQLVWSFMSFKNLWFIIRSLCSFAIGPVFTGKEMQRTEHF